jgi:uncharacterized protein YndB with AHSA1/START domain
MALKESREVLIDATPEAIIDCLADVRRLPSWSPVHKHVEVVDAYGDGRPHHVRMRIKVIGIVDDQLVEYHWGPDWLVWDVLESSRQDAQHAEYMLAPEAGKARVRFDLTVEPEVAVPVFLLKRASRIVMENATEGLRRAVEG